MILFIGNIPAHSTKGDFIRFVTKLGSHPLSWLPFVSRPAFRHCQILRIEDPERSTVEFHGLVSIQPTKSCRDLPQKLNGKKFKGRTVEVRRYFTRSFRMDRRIVHTDSESVVVERRRGDRRRPALNTQLRAC